MSTMNGAFLTPRSRIPGFLAARPLCSARCTFEANSRDSLDFFFQRDLLHQVLEFIDRLSEAAFSRAATSRASAEEVKFR